MASPQAENGHLDIANELAEAFARIRLSGEEGQVLWVVLRKTYGWHKKEDAISLTQFVELTGIKKPNIVRATKKLLSKKIITVINIDNAPAQVYKINKDYEQWQPLSKKITLSKKIITVIKKDNLPLSKKIPTKETTTKEKKENTSISKKGRTLEGRRQEMFFTFWDTFSYKSGKAEAMDSFLDIKGFSDEVFDKIISAAKREADLRPGKIAQGKTPKMAQGWLTARRWEDESLTEKKSVW